MKTEGSQFSLRIQFFLKSARYQKFLKREESFTKQQEEKRISISAIQRTKIILKEAENRLFSVRTDFQSTK